jgi:hypothetical protein
MVITISTWTGLNGMAVISRVTGMEGREIILHHLPGQVVCHLTPEAITGGILTLMMVGARAVP